MCAAIGVIINDDDDDDRRKTSSATLRLCPGRSCRHIANKEAPPQNLPSMPSAFGLDFRPSGLAPFPFFPSFGDLIKY